jgi:hypothetical protein
LDVFKIFADCYLFNSTLSAPLLQQRLMGGWDLEFEDEDELQQRRMMNVTVLHKDIVTPYR